MTRRLLGLSVCALLLAAGFAVPGQRRPATHVLPGAEWTRAAEAPTSLVPTSLATTATTTSRASRARVVLLPPSTRPTKAAITPGDPFACIRHYESGGNYATNTGNGYYGAYQFSLGTWRSVGGHGLPSDASPAEQDERARILQRRSGWGQWPVASRKCGLS